jgi:pyridoxine 5-phosphate synthase
VVQRLKKGGARVSLFCDPDATRAALEAASATGADRVEFYTGPYGGTYDDPARAKEELAKLEASGRLAAGLGLGINAGHDLTVDNLPALARALPNLLEVSIGHGLTADALEHGMAETVRRFVRACG